jgi:hypothetical protein
MADERLRTTIVNHVARYIPVSPDVVWSGILEEYVDARKFRELGYTIDAIDDPAAIDGSYRMRLEQNGVLVDDRICRITELDPVRRRLSIFGDCLTNGMIVYVTYHAGGSADGTTYMIDCHSNLFLDLPENADREEVRKAVDRLQSQFDDALTGYLDSVGTKHERP